MSSNDGTQLIGNNKNTRGTKHNASNISNSNNWIDEEVRKFMTDTDVNERQARHTLSIETGVVESAILYVIRNDVRNEDNNFSNLLASLLFGVANTNPISNIIDEKV